MVRIFWWLRLIVLVTALLSAISIGTVTWMWRERPDVSELEWPIAESVEHDADAVTVTWLGISTLLFDDGETQILTDGTFTRLPITDIVLLRQVSSDVANINRVLAEYRINRLSAIIPVHSHFDHAMDAGLVANRTNAVILGSESTANIARGAHVPVDQYQILASGESRQFGKFTITLIDSRHAPIGIGDRTWFAGTIEEPLEQPARVYQWREGVSYSVFISHPRGTTLVQGSAGFVRNNLRGRSADVVILGIAGLASLGRDYVDTLWAETVTSVGAMRVFPVHFEDVSQPFGEVVLFPEFFDNVLKTAGWMNDLAARSDPPVEIRRLPLGKPIVLY